MFTSRAEFRLHLRIDNADRRLTPHGRRVGLICDAAWADFQAKQDRHASLKQLLEKTRLTPEMLQKVSTPGTATLPCHPERSEAKPNAVEGPFDKLRAGSCVKPEPSTSLGVPHPARFSQGGSTPDAETNRQELSSALGQPLAQLLKRPEITIEHLVPLLRELAPDVFEANEIRENPRASVPALSSALRNQLKSVETEIKDAGYLQQQQKAIERLKKAEQRHIPDWFDYRSVSGLSREMQEKLLKIRPRTLAHASSIPGVTPAAVSLVNVYIEIQGKRRAQAAAL
jgi:tRNA uridine 5-carboxymethylaminomethyl modification enzyme